jgi:hypothetical protein
MRELLIGAARLKEELIETLEVTKDKQLVQDIDEALSELREGDATAG